MKKIFGIIFLCFGIQSAANATIITATFDEFGDHIEASVGSKYLGLKWTGIGVIAERIYGGYVHEAISANTFGYAWCCGSMDSIATHTGTFDFLGGYFGTLQPHPAAFTIRGFTDGIETYNRIVNVTQSLEWIDLNLIGVNKVIFDPQQFSNLTFDDLVFSVDESNLLPWKPPVAIPESGSIVLLAIGLFAIFCRRLRWLARK